jgi:hypothetical protein
MTLKTFPSDSLLTKEREIGICEHVIGLDVETTWLLANFRLIKTEWGCANIVNTPLAKG